MNMKIHDLKPHIQAVIQPEGSEVSQVGCNAGLIHTSEGTILIDTSISVKRMKLILEQADVQTEDIRMVIFTHVHADHLNGYNLIRSPAVGHVKAKLILRRKCDKYGQELTTFKDQLEMEVGGVRMELIHTGGHTPESLVVWLPEERVLFSGDLIFSGIAPFLASVTNFDALVKALRWLPSLGAEVIVPGHGVLCDDGEASKQADYLESTWKVIQAHVKQGHPLGTIRKDPDLPRVPGGNAERNIEWIYKRLTR